MKAHIWEKLTTQRIILEKNCEKKPDKNTKIVGYLVFAKLPKQNPVSDFALV